MKVFPSAVFALMYILSFQYVSAAQLQANRNEERTGRTKAEIRRIIRNTKAEAGVAVVACTPACNSGHPMLVRINDRKRYPLMSVMKMHQALWVTDSLSRAGLPLETCIGITGDRNSRERLFLQGSCQDPAPLYSPAERQQCL